MLGGYFENYGLLLTGRVLFGLGGEWLTVTQSLIVSIWFKENNELAFAMGLNISISRFKYFNQD